MQKEASKNKIFEWLEHRDNSSAIVFTHVDNLHKMPKWVSHFEAGITITYFEKEKRLAMSAPARVTGFPRLLRGKATRKGCPGGREGTRGTLTVSSQCGVATWNCGGLSKFGDRR